MKWLTGVGLLASAFAPLVAVLALVRMNQLGWAGWVILGTCLVAVLFLALVLASVAKIQERTVVSTSVRHADERVLAFTSSYLVPVVVAAFAPPEVATLVATLVLLALMVVIYVRASLYHLNPTLAVIGFRLYEVTTENGTIVMLLTRRRHIPQRGSVRGRYLSENIAVQWGGRT
ncbi:hypothetical protein MF406_13920 [Georgenia sp. TF02-10]|uniref:hypothetical protein n=1 Tax=Georgenia sp. TF02-10 TaxID=2917725 RepID=UPI001FA71527|nr:hypothetical protein [Georgenia sp. TF02-10]UNX54033.1 hypothetical protein MF406_13920 [Georgenia sp. TF02-10]